LRAALHAAEPNPFNQRTLLRFDVPATAGSLVPTRLEVFDLKGRLVRQIHVGPLAPGAHALEWDGRDDGGRSVGSGVYLAVLRCAGEQRSLKMSLVK
jgi:flagellar hook assembly protein FlgD